MDSKRINHTDAHRAEIDPRFTYKTAHTADDHVVIAVRLHEREFHKRCSASLLRLQNQHPVFLIRDGRLELGGLPRRDNFNIYYFFTIVEHARMATAGLPFFLIISFIFKVSELDGQR